MLVINFLCFVFDGLTDEFEKEVIIVILITIYLFIILDRFKWVSVLGTKYKAACTLEIGTDEYDNSIFGQVLKITPFWGELL